MKIPRKITLNQIDIANSVDLYARIFSSLQVYFIQ